MTTITRQPRHTYRVTSRIRARLCTRGDDGTMTLELVLWAPVLVLVLMIVVAGGRIVHARSQSTGAARDASRAVSLYRGSGDGDSVARAAASRTLSDEGISCRNMRVDVSGGRQPGDMVTVDVYCTAALADLAVPGLPGSYTLHSTASTPIEKTRSQ